MVGSRLRPLVGTPLGPRARVPVGVLCLGCLAWTFSGGRVAAKPEVSPGDGVPGTPAGELRPPPPSPTDRGATPAPPIASAAEHAEFGWLGSGARAPAAVSVAPALNSAICRTREAAERQILGREYVAGDSALICAPFESGSLPIGRMGLAGQNVVASGRRRVAPLASPHFVPVEPESSLDHFNRALERLAEGDDEDGKVRILAYGASHTQADVYPGYLRAYLQRRFGDGGRGFVPLGRVNAWHRTLDTRVRHRALTVRHARTVEDMRSEPLGLLGAALVGRSGGAFGEITTAEDSPNTRFEVHYLKQPGGGDFSLYLNEKRLAVVATRANESALAYHRFEAPQGRHTIRAQLRGNGEVRLFGVVAETVTAGIVVDTLGIGGSRMGGNLRWNEDGWIEAVRHRKPDLVTFAYGTNEAADKNLSIAAYSGQVRAVLARMRKALPEVSCVLIAPFDLPALVQSRLLAIIDAQRRISKEFGCGFWDAYGFMGGRGSIRRWASAKPPLASSDHIHLTRRGYVYAGTAIGDALLRTYDLHRSSSQMHWLSR